MIGRRERREFGKEAPRAARLGVKMRILFFAEHHGRCGTADASWQSQLKDQAAAADVFDAMWMSMRGAVGIKLHRMSIGCEAPAG